MNGEALPAPLLCGTRGGGGAGVGIEKAPGIEFNHESAAKSPIQLRNRRCEELGI